MQKFLHNLLCLLQMISRYNGNSFRKNFKLTVDSNFFVANHAIKSKHCTCHSMGKREPDKAEPINKVLGVLCRRQWMMILTSSARRQCWVIVRWPIKVCQFRRSKRKICSFVSSRCDLIHPMKSLAETRENNLLMSL